MYPSPSFGALQKGRGASIAGPTMECPSAPHKRHDITPYQNEERINFGRGSMNGPVESGVLSGTFGMFGLTSCNIFQGQAFHECNIMTYSTNICSRTCTYSSLTSTYSTRFNLDDFSLPLSEDNRKANRH